MPDFKLSRRQLCYVTAFAAACGVCAAGAAKAWRYSLGPVDDAFISLRYATNWAAGEGLCFNPGERVEGYTNFLLVLIEAAAIRCGVDPLLAMVCVGWVSLFALAFVFTLFVIRRVFPDCPRLSGIAGLIACLNPVLLCWAGAGMESCLYALLLMLSVMTVVFGAGRKPGARFLRRSGSIVTVVFGAGMRGRTSLAAGLLVLAGMTRPEAAALLPVMALVVYLRYRSVCPVVQFVSIFVVGFGLYFTLRALYFGHLFPNTFYAKVDYGGLLLALRGATYVGRFILAALPLFALALFGVALIRGAPLWVKAFALMAGAQLAIIVYEGGDHFAMYRYMVPVIPFLSGLALYPCAHLPRRRGLSDRAAIGLVVLGLVVLGGSHVVVGMQYQTGDPTSATQFEDFVGECSLARDWGRVGRYLAEHAAPDASICTMAIGAVGYYSGLRIIDAYGIVDPFIAHQPRRLGAGCAGHEKYDSAYVLSRKPTYILIFYYFTPHPIWAEALEAVVWGEFNKDLLRRPALWKEYDLRAFWMDEGYFNIFVRRDTPAAVPVEEFPP